MTKEVVEKKGGFSAEARLLVRHFYDTTGLKCTKAEFMRATGTVKALLIAGYTNQEVKSAIDWCLENKHEIYSLGYVARCINDILTKVKIAEINKELKDYSEQKIKKPLFSSDLEQYAPVEDDNSKKFKAKERRSVKGI